MSAPNTWHGDRDGFVAEGFRFSVGHETLRAEGAGGGGYDGFVQGRERDKHQHAHSPHHDHYHHQHHNSYPHSYNYLHNTSGVEVGQGEDTGNSYLTSNAETVSIASHNPSVSASFFPDLSVSPSPEPELQLYTLQTTHSSPVSSDFDSSVGSSPALDAQGRPDTEHERFPELGPPLFSTFEHTRSQFDSVSQQTPTTPLKRKRGRPPKNPATRPNSSRHRFSTFKNGFAMSFTAEDDYRVVADDEFDGNIRQPIEDAITLDPKKRAEKQRAPPATAAATRERRQMKPPAASTGPALTKGSAKKGKAQSAKAVPLDPAGRASSRAKRATNKAAPKYNMYTSDEGEDEDDKGDEDHKDDNFSGPSNSNSSSEENSDDDEGEDGHLERVTSAGHSLRARGKLSKPDRLKEYVSVDSALRRGKGKKKGGSQRKGLAKGKHSEKYTRLGRGLSCQHCHGKRIRCDGKQPKCSNCVRGKINCISRIWVNGRAEIHPGEEVTGENMKNIKGKATTTQRGDIRLAIQEGATKKRHNFFRAYEHLFLPLLPEKNFIIKLKETEEKEKQKEKEKEQERRDETKGETKDGEGDIKMEENEENQTLGEALESNEKDAAEETKHEAVPYQLLEKQPSGYVTPRCTMALG